MIKVLFFASLREQLGQSSTQIDYQDTLTTTQVWQQATGQPELPDNVLIARNQDYCDRDTQVSEGDEIAFFPPVTGG